MKLPWKRPQDAVRMNEMYSKWCNILHNIFPDIFYMEKVKLPAVLGSNSIRCPSARPRGSVEHAVESSSCCLLRNASNRHDYYMNEKPHSDSVSCERQFDMTVRYQRMIYGTRKTAIQCYIGQHECLRSFKYNVHHRGRVRMKTRRLAKTRL